MIYHLPRLSIALQKKLQVAETIMVCGLLHRKDIKFYTEGEKASFLNSVQLN